MSKPELDDALVFPLLHSGGLKRRDRPLGQGQNNQTSNDQKTERSLCSNRHWQQAPA